MTPHHALSLDLFALIRHQGVTEGEALVALSDVLAANIAGGTDPEQCWHSTMMYLGARVAQAYAFRRARPPTADELQAVDKQAEERIEALGLNSGMKAETEAMLRAVGVLK